MSCITKHLFIVLISLFCNFNFCNESEDLDYVSVLDKPSFSIESQDRQITLTGETSNFRKSSEFTIQSPDFKLNSNKLSVNINKNVFKCWICDYSGTKISPLIRRFAPAYYADCLLYTSDAADE